MEESQRCPFAVDVVACIGCGLNLSKLPKDRRRMHGSHSSDNSSERVLEVWRELTESVEKQEAVMCRHCFRKYEKLAKLLSEVRMSLENLKEANRSSISDHPGTPSRKRSNESNVMAARKYRVEVQTIDSSSPPVAVSSIHDYYELVNSKRCNGA